MVTCKFCNKEYKNKYTLKTHQKNTKRCLKMHSNIITDIPMVIDIIYKCNSCDKHLSDSRCLKNHYKICIQYITDMIEKKQNKKISILQERYESLLDKKDKEIFEITTEKDKEIFEITTEKDKDIFEIKNLNNKVTKLENRIDEITDMAIQRPFENETYIDNDFNYEIKEYKLSSLDIGEDHTIEHRDEDGYINVTNLCKAGGKLFKNWSRIHKTKAFLKALSRSVDIRADLLIKYISGGLNENRATWVHPHVAINIAQWISPEFDVKVSAWVYEAMMTGKVDITSTKTYKDIQKENKILKDKYLKRRPRVEYKEKYVIYILTTRLMQKERRYIMGKATDLTNRLSTYNKSDEHRVVYYKGCGNAETMSLVENAVFHHLQKYREQANRERFILPEKEEISLFSSCIKKSVEYFKKSDS